MSQVSSPTCIICTSIGSNKLLHSIDSKKLKPVSKSSLISLVFFLYKKFLKISDIKESATTGLTHAE